MSKHDELLGRWVATQDRIRMEYEAKDRKIVRRMRWQFVIAISIPAMVILASIIIHWLKS